MKVAVYAIALNESKFAQRFVESCSEADLIIVGDTGSTDSTQDILEDCGALVIPVNIKPWRFDFARNVVLGSIPTDIDWCVIMDLDEVLEAGWRKHLEGVGPEYNSVFVKYVWSHHRKEFGQLPYYEESDHNIAFHADRIHSRSNWIWRNPAHEHQYPYGDFVANPITLPITIHHWPDHNKSRGYYLPLLKMRWQETPDAGTAYYYGRELFYNQRYQEAIEVLKINYDNTRWEDEKIWVALTIAGCYHGLGAKHDWFSWLENALRASSSEEPICKISAQLAFYYYDNQEWPMCNLFAKEAIDAIKPNKTHFDDKHNESLIAYDMAAISAYRLGDMEDAIRYGEQALELSPSDERLKKNLEYYREAVPVGSI